MTYEEFKKLMEDGGYLVSGTRYQNVIMKALNDEHDSGFQDAFSVMEGMARVLAQMIAHLPPDHRAGMIYYVERRALELAPEMAAKGLAAKTEVSQ